MCYLHAVDWQIVAAKKEEQSYFLVSKGQFDHKRSTKALTIMRTTAAGLQMTIDLNGCHTEVGHPDILFVV